MASKTMKSALLLVGGSLIGAGLGMLYAPQSGRRTRRDLNRFANRVGDRTRKAVDGLSDDISCFADSVGEKANSILSSGKKLALVGKKAFDRKRASE